MAFKKSSYSFPAKETTGVERSVGVNGTHRSSGEQTPYSNSYYPKGTLGTVGSSKPFVPGPNSNTNRTGEGSGY